MEDLEDTVTAFAEALRQALVIHERPVDTGSIESLKMELNTSGGGRLSLEYRHSDEEGKLKPSRMSSTQAALSNDIVLEKILESASSVDFLKNYRQVNKKWKEISDLILNRKRMFITRYQLTEWQLRRCYVPLCSDFPNTAAGHHPVDQLVKLVHKRNDCFVGNGLYLNASLWTISSSNVRKFLRAYGKKIKYLGIDYNRFRSIHSFSQFLAFFPNLQRLWTRKIQISQPLPQLAPVVDLSFPHLTSIHFGNADPKLHGFLLDIIKGSQSLQQVLNFPCALASAIAEAEKAGIVQEINFKGATDEEISVCARIDFHLRKFFLPHKGSPALLQVLQANQKTLEKVTVVFPNKIISSAIHIYLEGLKELTLKEAPELVQNGNTVHIRFPPSFSLRRHYYRFDLHLVGLEMYEIPVMDITLGPWFMSASPGIRNMSADLAVYPSVTDLRIGCKNFEDLLPLMDTLVRNCRQIRCLHLYNVEYGRFSRHSLDAALTGIPDPTVCGDLLRSGVNEQTDIRGLQVLPSISDLTELQELKISFSHRGRDIYKRDGTAKFFTRLSILCAFKRMPSLQKLCLAYDQYDNFAFGADDLAEILEPFKSIATIVHEASPW